MRSGIIYLLTGPSHGVRLVVSLWSLRKYYTGPITVFTTHPLSHEIGRRCSEDCRLNITHVKTKKVAVRRNADFLTKVALLPHSPFDNTAYLDCDTLVAGSIDELLDFTGNDEFHATQFANWLSTTRRIRNRIDAWRHIDQSRYPSEWLERLLEDAMLPQPAVNGGVFAWQRDCSILKPWLDLAMTGWQTFICDEIALQLLLSRYRHTVLDCRFNCSPVYSANQKDARIWHFHGERHVENSLARSIWLPVYYECLRENVAQLAGWTPAGDSRLLNIGQQLA